METVESNSEDNFSFEDFSNQNGMTYWWATDLMKMLGYTNLVSFQKVIDRSTKSFVSLNISHYDNIIHTKRTIDGVEQTDFKLSRFACYMSVMNASSSKPEVVKAKAYFASQTRKFEVLINQQDGIDRLMIREELKEGTKSLNSIAKDAGVSDYAKFTNAGYLGLYNMESWKLAKKRKVEKRKLMDNMGRTELAANLFRVTQTEERIKSKKITGQSALEHTHRKVGQEVRSILKENTGVNPENLKQAEQQLPTVKKELKKVNRNMIKEDKKK